MTAVRDASPHVRAAHHLVRAAVLAPSLHNSQPWLFACSDNALLLYADGRRRLPFCDPYGRQLVISAGAALFNLRLAIGVPAATKPVRASAPGRPTSTAPAVSAGSVGTAGTAAGIRRRRPVVGSTGRVPGPHAASGGTRTCPMGRVTVPHLDRRSRGGLTTKIRVSVRADSQRASMTRRRVPDLAVVLQRAAATRRAGRAARPRGRSASTASVPESGSCRVLRTELSGR